MWRKWQIIMRAGYEMDERIDRGNDCRQQKQDAQLSHEFRIGAWGLLPQHERFLLKAGTGFD